MQEPKVSNVPAARDIASCFGQLAHELRGYISRVLPRLADDGSPERWPLDWAASAMQDDAEHLALTLNGREPISLQDEPPEPRTYQDIQALIASAREVLYVSARNNLLHGNLQRTDGIPDGWHWDGKRMVWSLTAMVMLMPDPTRLLEERALFVASKLGIEATNAADVRRALAEMPAKRISRVLRRMDRGAFCKFMECLLSIAPNVPDSLILIPVGSFGPAASSNKPIFPGGRPDNNAPGVTLFMSYLLGIAMELRANNHFSMIWQTAVRRQTRGSWHPHMAPAVLDILYQKWLILHELKETRLKINNVS